MRNMFSSQREKFSILSLMIMLIVGGAFTSIGLLIYSSSQIDESWSRVSGSIVDVSSRISDGSTTYSPVVQYDVDGKSYTVGSNMSSSSRPNIGDTREVAYDPNRPAAGKLVPGGGERLLLLLFPLIGIILLVLGPVMFMRSLKRSKNIKRLISSGHKLQGVLVDIMGGASSKNSSYKIVVSATDTNGTVQNYVSDPLKGIGGLAMADYRNSPIPIDVFVDPGDPQHYYVDISDIPNLTPARITELISAAAARQSTQQGAFTTQTVGRNDNLPPSPQF